MRFELNPTNFDDWLGLHKLLVGCFAYMDGIIDPPSSLHNITPQELQTKAEAETLLLVWDADTLVACAFFDLRADAVYVGKIAVVNSHQKRGIANRLIESAVKLAKQNNKKYLELDTRIELTNNHQAFGKMGFNKTGEFSHKGYNRVTFITMRRKLGQHNDQ